MVTNREQGKTQLKTLTIESAVMSSQRLSGTAAAVRDRVDGGPLRVRLPRKACIFNIKPTRSSRGSLVLTSWSPGRMTVLLVIRERHLKLLVAIFETTWNASSKPAFSFHPGSRTFLLWKSRLLIFTALRLSLGVNKWQPSQFKSFHYGWYSVQTFFRQWFYYIIVER